MRNTMGLSWDHGGRRVVALLLAVVLVFSLVGMMAAQSFEDYTAAPAVTVDHPDDDMTVAGASWSFKSMMFARGASWS